MPPGSAHPTLAALRTFGLAAIWTVAAALMLLSNTSDPYDASRQGSARYGHNSEGALQGGLVVSLVELVVLYLVLQPWKRAGRAWLRILAMLVLLVPWALFSGVLCMHAGGITAIHFLWLLAVVLVLVLALVVSPWTQTSRPGTTR